MDGKSFRMLFGLYLIEEQPTKKATKLRDKILDYFVSQEREIYLATHLRGRHPGVKV